MFCVHFFSLKRWINLSCTYIYMAVDMLLMYWLAGVFLTDENEQCFSMYSIVKEWSNCSVGLHLFSKLALLVQGARNSGKEKDVIPVLLLVHWQDCWFLCLQFYHILGLIILKSLWKACSLMNYCVKSALGSHYDSCVEIYCLSLLEKKAVFGFNTISFFAARYKKHNSICG